MKIIINDIDGSASHTVDSGTESEVRSRFPLTHPVQSLITETTVCGVQVQLDNSGVGHNWRDIDRSDIPANVVMEIEGQILDGGNVSHPDYVGSNGLHYRWSD